MSLIDEDSDEKSLSEESEQQLMKQLEAYRNMNKSMDEELTSKEQQIRVLESALKKVELQQQQRDQDIDMPLSPTKVTTSETNEQIKKAGDVALQFIRENEERSSNDGSNADPSGNSTVDPSKNMIQTEDIQKLIGNHLPPYLLNSKKFMPGESTVWYSGPYWDNREIEAAIDTFLNGACPRNS